MPYGVPLIKGNDTFMENSSYDTLNNYYIAVAISVGCHDNKMCNNNNRYPAIDSQCIANHA